MRRLLLLALLLLCAAPTYGGWYFDPGGEEWLTAPLAPSGADGFPLTIHARWSTSSDLTKPIVSHVEAAGSNIDRQTLYRFNAAGGQDVSANSRSASSGTQASHTSTQYAQDGTWHTSTAVFTGATSRASFLDGGGKGTNAGTVTASTLIDQVTVGGTVPSNASLGSDISVGLVAIYDTPLSDAQVGSLGAGAWPPYIASSSLAVFLICAGQGTTEPGIVSGLTFDSLDIGAAGADDFPSRVGHKNLAPWPGMQ